MKRTKSQFLLMVNVCLVVAVAVLMTGCSFGKEGYRYSTQPTFDVMYNEATETSDVIVNLIVQNNGQKSVKTVTFKCYFLNEAGNILDTKEETFTLNLAADEQKTFALTFTDVQGKPQDINLTGVKATYDNMTVGGVLNMILNWLFDYWYVILLIVMIGGLLISVIVSVIGR